MSEFLDIATASNLTYKQKLLHLAQAAENSVQPIKLAPRTQELFNLGAIDFMCEGNAPYRPRYICPDYNKFVREGSRFLRLDPAQNLDDALWNLATIYDNVPSVTSRPVYVGQLDKILDPFLQDLDDAEIKPRLKRFLNYIDRTVASGYSHANLGPEDTRAGRLLLEVDRELNNAVPNFTLKYDPDITSDEFMRLAIQTTMEIANPAFANHRIHKETYPGDYTIVSCYNILPMGGGAYTLNRILLPGLADLAHSPEHFVNELLPEACGLLADAINDRIRWMVEDSNFFETSFLAQEGLIERTRFCAMFAVAGMHECIQKLLNLDTKRSYGSDSEANDLADTIMSKIYEEAYSRDALYSEVVHNKFTLHAQAGFADMQGVTPGVRIRVGDEPEVFFDHLRHSARMHRFFNSGVSDIFPVEPTAKRNPDAILDVIKGAFALDDKYMSFYSSESDLVRITGFLVKRSEMEKYARGEAVLADTSHDGEGNWRANDLADRKVQLSV